MEYLGDYKLTLLNIDKNIIFEKYIKNEYFLRKFRNKCRYSKKIKILCEEKCIKIWLVVYRIRNLCYNVYVNKRRGDDILETLQKKLNRLVNESVKELKEIGLGDNLNTNMTFEINYRAKQRLGQCCNKCDINISSWLLEVGSDKDIKNTIIHEILHTFKDTIGHKAKWQYYARYVNNRTEYNITRTTSINNIYARANIQRPTKHIHYKWEITCTKCGAVWKKQKMTTKVLNGFTEGNRIHRKCGGTDFRIVDLDNCEVIW